MSWVEDEKAEVQSCASTDVSSESEKEKPDVMICYSTQRRFCKEQGLPEAPPAQLQLPWYWPANYRQKGRPPQRAQCERGGGQKRIARCSPSKFSSCCACRSTHAFRLSPLSSLSPHFFFLSLSLSFSVSLSLSLCLFSPMNKRREPRKNVKFEKYLVNLFPQIQCH